MTGEDYNQSIKQFTIDVGLGLSKTQKSLSSKYFYDETGDKIFQEIMSMPEYYLTNSEYEILENHKNEIVDIIDAGKQCFDIVEMGAGDGYKTKIILRHLLEKKCDVQFMPIDISKKGLETLKRNLEKELPELRVQGIAMDYFHALKQIKEFSCRTKVFLFLGSNMGNFTYQESIDFLQMIAEGSEKGDKLLLGLDLKKDPAIILNAYNDKAGITRRFNLNLLHRINRELGANFEIINFSHEPVYDPQSGKAISFLVSLTDQEVDIPACNKKFQFRERETILTEISQKYDTKIIEDMAGESGFRICDNFFDDRRYFVNSLWEKE